MKNPTHVGVWGRSVPLLFRSKILIERHAGNNYVSSRGKLPSSPDRVTPRFPIRFIDVWSSYEVCLMSLQL